MIYLEDKVKIVSNLDDHKGYKKGQVVEVIAMDDDGMITVEGANGTQWYLDAEEVELVKKGARKFNGGGEVEGGFLDLSTKEKSAMYTWIDNFLKKYSGDDNLSQSLDMYKEFAKKFGKNKEQTHDIIDKGWARSRGYAKGSTVKGGGNKYYVIDAKSGDVVSKGFDTEEEAKVEKYKIFEKNGNFFLTQKKMSKGSTVKGGFKLGDKVKVVRGANKGEKGVVSNTDSDFFGDYTIDVRGHKLSGFKADDLIKYAKGSTVKIGSGVPYFISFDYWDEKLKHYKHEDKEFKSVYDAIEHGRKLSNMGLEDVNLRKLNIEKKQIERIGSFWRGSFIENSNFQYANGGGVDNDRLWTYDIKEDRILIYPTIEFIGDEHNDIEDIKRQLRAEGYKQPFIVENSNYWTYDIKGDHILIYPTTEDDEDAVGYDVGSVMKQLRAEGYRQALVVSEKKYANGGNTTSGFNYSIGGL